MSDHAGLGSYDQFCPVAMASEIVCARWTPLLLREMLSGSTRFNDIRRGLPRMSPTLLSKRLKQLARAGVITVRPAANAGAVEYRLTTAGEELRDTIMSLGAWGQRWIESSVSLKNLDPALLMWDMRRNLRPSALPDRTKRVIKFEYLDMNAGRRFWWLVVEGDSVDLCKVDPGFDIDLYVIGKLRSMTSVWMGHSTLRAEVSAGNLELTGDASVARSMHDWLGLSPFAKEKPRIAS